MGVEPEDLWQGLRLSQQQLKCDVLLQEREGDEEGGMLHEGIGFRAVGEGSGIRGCGRWSRVVEEFVEGGAAGGFGWRLEVLDCCVEGSHYGEDLVVWDHGFGAENLVGGEKSGFGSKGSSSCLRRLALAGRRRTSVCSPQF